MPKKKSLLERLKLVESTEEEFDQAQVLATLQAQAAEIDQTDSTQSSVEFQLDEDFLNVSDIYEKAGLGDLSQSIFKVNEFEKHLPDNLPTDVKRQSVIGILSASGLQVDNLVEDALKRLEALKGVTTLTSKKSDSYIIEKEQEITDLLNKVDSLKQSIVDRKAAQEKQNSLINEELDKINQVVKFVAVK